MIRRPLVALLAAAVLFCTPAFAHEKLTKTVTLTDAKGATVGTAVIIQEKKGVEIRLTVSGLTPGEHAIHFHQKPSCVAPDFKSAGGHFNPGNTHHGLNNPAGPHAGDMANFTVAADGTAKVTVKDERVTLEPGQPNSLFTDGGTALVIHAKADDLVSDPAGNAGDRVACGPITQ